MPLISMHTSGRRTPRRANCCETFCIRCIGLCRWQCASCVWLVQGVTIPSQRRYVRYWGQLCGRIAAGRVPPSVGPLDSLEARRKLADELMARENRAKLLEIGP
jgi:hypothetical protein